MLYAMYIYIILVIIVRLIHVYTTKIIAPSLDLKFD